MKISVTQKHIDEGRKLVDSGQRSSWCCPIARALQDATGLDWRCGYTIASLPTNATVDLPDEATAFIKRFGSREPLDPFDFEFWAAPAEVAEAT